MRFKLTIRPLKNLQKLTLQYNYPFAAWIYSKIKESDAEYGDFLHEKGYSVQNKNKTFKHFTFSNLVIPHKAKPVEKGEDFVLLSDKPLFVTVSFLMDEAAEDFIVGLFKNQQLGIYDKNYRAEFIIETVESLPEFPRNLANYRFIAKSPIVIAEKNRDRSDCYLEPGHESFSKLFIQNLWSKYESIHGNSLQMDASSLENLISVKLLDTSKMRSKLRIIKQGKNEQTRVRGFENFTFEIKAPSEIIEVGYYGGFGKYTSAAGMGFCELVQSDK